MAPTPPAISRIRSKSCARFGNFLELPYGPSMFSGGFALGNLMRRCSAAVVGPLRTRRTTVAVLCSVETSAIVKGL